jgi:hypothetical protein
MYSAIGMHRPAEPQRNNIYNSSNNHVSGPAPPSRGVPPTPTRQQTLPALPTNAAQVPTPSNYLASPRPSLPHTNTQLQVIDHPLPQPPHSPSYILPPDPNAEDGITLADIPQVIEATQNKSLPILRGRQHIAELNPTELLLVKYAALLKIAKSPLGDPALVEEMIEFLEAKKASFWRQIFKGDKKNMKKKGTYYLILDVSANISFNRGILRSFGASSRAGRCGFNVRCCKRSSTGSKLH